MIQQSPTPKQHGVTNRKKEILTILLVSLTHSLTTAEHTAKNRKLMCITWQTVSIKLFTVHSAYLANLLTSFLPTCFMGPSSLWQSNSFSTSQEVLLTLFSPNAHYRVHISLPLVPILSQIKPVPILLASLFSTPQYFAYMKDDAFHKPILFRNSGSNELKVGFPSRNTTNLVISER